MTTRAKLNFASLTSSVMMLLNVFSHPLGIPSGVQWALMIGVFVPLSLIFFYAKKLKAEKASDTGRVAMPPNELSAAQKKIRKRFIVIWVCVAAYSLTAPLWLPIAGVSLGTRGDFMIGVCTAALVSLIFAIRLRRMPNQAPLPTPMSVTPPAGQEARQP